MFFRDSPPLTCAWWRRWSDIALLALLALAVLLRGGKTLEVTWALVGVTCFLVIVSFSCRREGERAIPFLLWISVMLSMAWATASYLTSSVSNYGLDEVLRTVSLGLLFLWMVRRPRGDHLERGVIRILTAVTIIAATVGIAVYVLQPVGRFVGTFVDPRFATNYWPNAWAEYVLLTWPLVLFSSFSIVQESRGADRRVSALLLRAAPVGLVMGCLFLSYSRAGVLVFLCQVALLSLWAAKYSIPWRAVWRPVLSVLFVSLVIFFSVNRLRGLQHPVLSVPEKALFQTEEGILSVTERRIFWGQAIALANARPLLGWGPGSFRFVQPRIAEDVLATSDHAHNVFLKVAMDSGWPAALLLAIVLLLILGPSCRALAWGRREDALLRAKSFLIFLGIVGVLAHNLADYNLQFVGIALPFTLLLGMLFSDSRGEGTAKENNKFVHVFELVVAGFLLLVAVRDGAFILTSSCGRFLLAEGDIPGALRWFRRADGEWFARDLHLTEARLLLEAGRADEAALAIQKYLSANTEDYRGWKLQGEIAEARGDVSLALTSYEEASVRGRMVDLGTVRHSVAALGSVEGREALDARRTDVDNLLMMYRDAILENRHFIALSKNVEEYMRLTDLLSSWYPALEPQYEGWAAAVDRRAKIIRAAWETKSPGALW